MSKVNEQDFARAIRGYNTEEVDEYIDTLKKKCSSLEEDNELLAERAKSAKAELDESNIKRGLAEKELAEAQLRADKMIKETEAKIEKMLSEARAAAEKTEADAKMRADAMIGAALLEEKRINAELEANITEKERIYNAFCDKLNSFKASVFSQYAAHISALEQILANKVEYSYDLPEPEKTAPAPVPEKAEIVREEVITPVNEPKTDAASESAAKNLGIKIKRESAQGETVSGIMRELDEIKERIAEKEKKIY